MRPPVKGRPGRRRRRGVHRRRTRPPRRDCSCVQAAVSRNLAKLLSGAKFVWRKVARRECRRVLKKKEHAGATGVR